MLAIDATTRRDTESEPRGSFIRLQEAFTSF